MTMSDARKIYVANGGHFFDRDTMRFFGSRIESNLYKNRCFVTSDSNYDGSARYYNVRRFSEDFHDIDTVGEFNAITSKRVALAIAKTEV